MYLSEYDSDSEEDCDGVYLYQNEPEPDPIYKIICAGEDQAYCVLCDKKASALDTIVVLKRGSIIINVEDGPYICKNICNLLVFKYNYRGNGKYNNRLNIKNLRYVKNQILTLYAGCADSNSDFGMLNIDIRNFIILKYLDIVEANK
jgi:hypothetical protein